VVRAHPTVPPFLPANSSLEPTCAVACRPPVLANPKGLTHNSCKSSAGGIDVVFSDRKFSVWIDAGNGALGFDVACRSKGLHPRTGASLHKRCVPALQFRHSRCRPRDGLHGPEQIPAFATLPGPIQVWSRAKRCLGQDRGPADGHPAGKAAQARHRQAAEGQETVIQAGKTRSDLTVLSSFQGPFARQTDALLGAYPMNMSQGRGEG